MTDLEFVITSMDVLSNEDYADAAGASVPDKVANKGKNNQKLKKMYNCQFHDVRIVPRKYVTAASGPYI